MIKRLLPFFILLLSSLSLSASHMLGGDITWRCDSNQNYIFTLTLFADCDSNAVNLTVNQTISGPQNINLTRVAIKNITPGGQSCNICQVEAHIYESAPVTLTGTPPAQGWVFSWMSCCRNPYLVNTPGNQPIFLRAIMYPYIAPGNSQPLNASQCNDQSPYFSVLEFLSQNTGKRTVLNQQALDREGDSIFVQFADPLQGSNTPMNWDSGYAAHTPLPHPGIDPSHDSLRLDHYSGSITTDISTQATEGYYTTALKIESWRRGQGLNGLDYQLISSVQREFPIQIRHINNSDKCSSYPPSWRNSAPAVIIDTTVYPEVKMLAAAHYQLEVIVGDTIDFRFSASDFDQTASCSFQDISFSGQGSFLAMPYSGGSCDLAPCATVTPKAGQGGYTVPLTNEMRFAWIPELQHSNPLDWMAGKPTRHNFNFRFSDNFCPIPASSAVRLEVLLKRKTFFGQEEEKLLSSPLRVYPNPLAEQFTLDLDPRLREDKMLVSIFSLRGERVYHQNWQGAGSAPLLLPSPSVKGVYLLTVTVGGKVYTTKIVK